jgi:hypothetical protein
MDELAKYRTQPDTGRIRTNKLFHRQVIRISADDQLSP